MSGEPRVRRRVLVAGLGAAGLTGVSGCAGSARETTPAARTSMTPTGPGASTSSTAAVDADVALVHAAIADERALLTYVTRAASQLGGPPAGVLRLLAAQQRRHVAVLRAALTDTGPDHVGPVPPRQRSRGAVLRTTSSLLATAQQRRRSDALAADSGLLARLLASISASHAVAGTLPELRA